MASKRTRNGAVDIESSDVSTPPPTSSASSPTPRNNSQLSSSNGKKRKRATDSPVDPKRSKLKGQQHQQPSVGRGAQDQKTDSVKAEENEEEAMDIDTVDLSGPSLSPHDSQRILLVLER